MVLSSGSGSGTIDVGDLSTFAGGTIADSGGSLSLPALADADSTTFQIGGGTAMTLTTLTQADGSSLEVSGGASLTLPDLTAYTSINNFATTTLEATGAGSVLSLPALSSLAFTSYYYGQIDLQTSTGGTLDLPALTQSIGPVVLSSGSGSGTIDVGDLSTFTGGTIADSGGSLSLPALADADGSDLEVSGGASLTLPDLTSYTSINNFATTTLEATGAGSVLSLPALTSLAFTSYYYGLIQVQALSGGEVELPLLTQVDGPVALESNGTESVLELSVLQSLTGIGGSQSLTITQGGSVIDPNLTSFANVTITTDPTGSFTVPSNQTFSFPSSTSTIKTGTFLVQGSVNLQNNATINVEGGLTINGQGGLSVSTNSTLDVSGNLLGNTTNVAGFNPLGTVVFDGAGDEQLAAAVGGHVG